MSQNEVRKVPDCQSLTGIVNMDIGNLYKSGLNMDNTDRELISLLRHNARLPVATLAKKLGVARATVQNRMARLEESGVIAGYTLRLPENREETGIRALTAIGISGHHASQVKRALRGHPEVVAIHSTNGRWDLLAELRADTLEAFDKLLNSIRTIQHIENTETSILLSTYKR